MLIRVLISKSIPISTIESIPLSIAPVLLCIRRVAVAVFFGSLFVTSIHAGEPASAEVEAVSGNAEQKNGLNQTISPADARHLLSRTGFDAAPEAQLAIAGLTRSEAIDVIMSGFSTQPQRAMPAWTQDVAPVYWTRGDLDDEQRRNFDRLRDREISQLRNWWVDEMLTTTSPQTERMVLFWHDHFATSYRGLNRQSMAMARQNQTFRKLGMGDMSSLLSAMIRDPALLRYLNNVANKRQNPNENLARELMELFTLGEGNYDEATVREAARSLTGYSVSPNRNLQPRFNFWQHDPKEKTLFGETGRFNGDDLITLLLKQPALDRFIATRFWHWLVADSAPTDAELMPIANAFRASGHRLDLLYRQTLESEAFWHSSNRGGIIKSPATLLIGTARMLDTPKNINHQLPRLLKLSGQDLLAPPNVSGWQEGAAWITPGRLLNRYSALEALLKASHGIEPNEHLDKKKRSMAALATAASMDASSNNAMAMSEDSANNNLMSVDGDDRSRALTLRLASEEFDGPARYRLELLSSTSSVLWTSGERVLTGGWDTSRYGPLEGRDQLPWQNISLLIENEVFAKGSTLRVHYINDAAGVGGDRNLYVGALGVLDNRSYPVSGSQSSACAPPNGADVGDLYCNGYVDIALAGLQSTNESEVASAVNTKTVLYASKHVHWARVNRKNGQIHANIVFQDVRFGERHWPIFTAQYRVAGDDDPTVWLHNQDCWPDCIKLWPECAWTDVRDPISRTISVSALGARNDDRACHVAALQNDEARLVDGLLIHSVDILSEVIAAEYKKSPNKRMNVKNGLAAMVERMQKADVVESFNRASPTQRTSLEEVPLWVQDEAARRRYPQEKTRVDLPLIAANLIIREQQIYDHGFSWATALAPGIKVSDLPGWSGDTEKPTDSSTVFDRVRGWLLHPAYQVY